MVCFEQESDLRQFIFMTSALWMLTALTSPAAGQADAGSSVSRDPTRPLEMGNAVPVQAAGALNLNAIIVKPDATVAFINGRPVKRGDTFNGFRITRIDPDRVFFDGEESGVLLLYPEIIKNRRPRESEQ